MIERIVAPRLADIIEAIERIRRVLDGVTFEAFEQNWEKAWCGSIILIALFMSGSSARTGSTTRSMHKPFEGRGHGHFADQEPARLS